VHILSLFGNEHINHNPGEALEAMQRSKLWCFTRYTIRYLSNCIQPLCQDLQKQELILTNRPLIHNKHVPKS
jgi:hypothetical protein